jgi:DNA topoisomerase-1
MQLVIVESPGKVKKLESFLGAGYTVMASVGHIRDLPEKGEGVAAPNYTPE